MYKKVHQYYDQLEFTKFKRHYKRVQEAFLINTARNLDHQLHICISAEARAAMVEWADWFIQLPTYTYICAYGYAGHLAMLPRYPSDRVVFMEFLWQLYDVQSHLRNKRKPTANFPLQMSIYRCKTIVDAKAMGHELERLNLKYLVERCSYDPWGHYSARLGDRSYQKSSMEDY